jgi:hypothetical protein
MHPVDVPPFAHPAVRARPPWTHWVLLLLGVVILVKEALLSQLWTHSDHYTLTEADRSALDALERTSELRADLVAEPWRYVVQGDGKIEVFDEGFLDTYVKVVGYPLQNNSEFDVAAVEAELTIFLDNGTQLRTPIQFAEGLRAGQGRVLKVLNSITVKGRAVRYELHVKWVRLNQN